ncbi:S-adenosyl-L-methionine-dependent methyltransferase-like [Syntrophomonas zehnderi OL-4]|uniref:S-adenosyl-L-methionine-dependent methyltransferase-like n=1 Tax=Syntrophomonas zehnderi OL-4 TaxID=690567 RepID=A0A0E3W2F7_9FIRM|nr:class I SAM-dependent methyltransferase [Syntrophomonas zehnderi]CFW97590.1 S-adenosyl-L-methionine-dependent methyltransferase-like [Syntrophomonas zehnderi OL-4]
MILKEFFDYYFQQVDEDVLKIFQDLLPSRENLADAYAEMFSRNDEESIAFLFEFYHTTRKLRETNPGQAILFNTHDNICFPFFVNYIWQVINKEQKEMIYRYTGTCNLDEIINCFNNDIKLRNWFRQEIGVYLGQEDLFNLNEIVSLQNFSSGGEYSFLKYVYPHVQKMQGRVLDAGCGAGFATLIMSQYMDVYSVDACRARLERAMALSNMMNNGHKDVFPQLIKLIEEELGLMEVYCEFPLADELLHGCATPAAFSHGSIDSLPFENDFFDMINCLDVIEHTYNPAAIVAEFSRVLKPGGRVFVTAPTKYGEAEQRIFEDRDGVMFPAMLHMHHFEPASLTALFADNGFREIELSPFDCVKWEDFSSVVDFSPTSNMAAELKIQPAQEVALQIFAIYEKK